MMTRRQDNLNWTPVMMEEENEGEEEADPSQLDELGFRVSVCFSQSSIID